MNKNLLVKMFGFPATLIHGDTLVLDRWRWLKKRLMPISIPLNVLDVGCGTGAFSIGLAKRGYNTLGLSWDERNQEFAKERARLCNAPNALFEVQDVRRLNERTDLHGFFDVVICLENIEHIINDQKLIVDMTACLKPGGRLLLTTPNFHYKAITIGDNGPFLIEETGWHVRRGYTSEDFYRLCECANLKIREISYCSGFLSQKVTYVWRKLNGLHAVLSFLLTLPLRLIPLLFDGVLTDSINYPYFSICFDARKTVDL